MKLAALVLLVLVGDGAVSAAAPDTYWKVFENAPWSGESLLSSQVDTFIPFESACADDFDIWPGGAAINVAEWYGGFYNGDPVPADWRVTIYADSGGLPGMVVYTETFPYAALHETLHAYDQFGYAHFSYRADFAMDVDLAVGAYWISFQGVNDFPPSSAVSVTTTVTGSEALQRFPIFGYDWTATSALFGVGYDIPFVIGYDFVASPGSVAALGVGGVVAARRGRREGRKRDTPHY